MARPLTSIFLALSSLATLVPWAMGKDLPTRSMASPSPQAAPESQENKAPTRRDQTLYHPGSSPGFVRPNRTPPPTLEKKPLRFGDLIPKAAVTPEPSPAASPSPAQETP